MVYSLLLKRVFMTRYYREFQYIICSSMGTKIVVLQQ